MSSPQVGTESVTASRARPEPNSTVSSRASIAAGLIARLPMGGFPAFFGAVLVVSAGVALSPLGARLATLPLGALVAFQAFRLPLELVLHTWAAQGTIPEAMTWSGQNWDIVSGVVALAIAPWAGRSRARLSPTLRSTMGGSSRSNALSRVCGASSRRLRRWRRCRPPSPGCVACSSRIARRVLRRL